MKLFQWAHRKFRQNSIDPFKDFTFGNPCCLTVQPTLDELHPYTNPVFKSTNQSRFLKPNQQESQTCYSELEDNRDVEKSQEESSTVMPELFQGFLTIGTLGAETATNEPATPTFAMPPENTFEKITEVTESDLKLINYELERFLGAEKERFYESSGRNSHVSTITLGGKQGDGAEDEDYGNTTVCPLQGYLLGSSIELPETVTEVKKERASLGELFHRTKITNQGIIETGETGETQLRQTHQSSKHIMSKLLKKVHTSKSWNTSESDANSASTNKKLSKVLRMFHRKVHSESSMNAKIKESHKGKIKNALHNCFHGYDTGDPIHPGKGRNFPSECKSEKWSQHCKKNRIPPKHGLTNVGSGGKRECWIKTDDEYLVLEL